MLVKPVTLESKIIQDADRLEASGAISIMRTFASAGKYNIPFYHTADPFLKKGRVIETENGYTKYALDLFYQRLLQVEKYMNTETAKELVRSRTEFLQAFLAQLATELPE